MDLGGVVGLSLHILSHHPLHKVPLDVRTRQRARVEQDLSNVARKPITVPHAVMAELMPSQEKVLKVQWGERVINSRHPLWHSVIVGVLRAEGELQECTRHRRCPTARASP